MIDIAKLGIHPNPSGVRTRDGREVRIYATDGGDKHPIHGAILQSDGWENSTWGVAGSFDVSRPGRYDLIPIPQKLVGWVNVLKGRRGNIFAAPVYDNEEEAKLQISQADYVATIRIEYEPKDAP